MKKSITGAVALLAGAVVAHSQGTVSFGDYYAGGSYNIVKFSNDGGATSTTLGGSGAHTGVAGNDTGVGSDWSVQLYGISGSGAAASTLVPAVLDGTASTPVVATLAGGGTGAFLGQWSSSAVGDISGTTGAGQAATVAVAAWYNNGGTIATYAAAQAAGVPTGFSSTGSVSTGGLPASGPPVTAPSLPQFGPGAGPGVITVNGTVPEPSTIALGVMGASAFLMRLRKKQ